jgi:hypothetical protein
MLDTLAAKKPSALARLPAFAMQEHRPAPPAGSKVTPAHRTVHIRRSAFSGECAM